MRMRSAKVGPNKHAWIGPISNGGQTENFAEKKKTTYAQVRARGNGRPPAKHIHGRLASSIVSFGMNDIIFRHVSSRKFGEFTAVPNVDIAVVRGSIHARSLDPTAPEGPRALICCQSFRAPRTGQSSSTARALGIEPELMLLEEPTQGMGHENGRTFLCDRARLHCRRPIFSALYHAAMFS
ncbi:hypothetical protein V1281_004703 [Nitrobacteraceae bacterium AZCC 2161]